jgi:hypothetical protein
MLSTLWLIASLTLIGAWVVQPPWLYWVPEQFVPQSAIPTTIANTRFAAIPAFQPLSFENRGSGIDPDLSPRPNNVTALNEFLPLYPVSTALARYLQDGSLRDMSALSVSYVVNRPWLHPDTRSLRGQLALTSAGLPDEARRAPPFVERIPNLPELTLSPLPRVGTLDTNIGAGNVFFGDARIARGPGVPADWANYSPVVPIVAPSRFADARQGWVDARLGFLSAPQLGQPFGGAMTLDSDALLAVHPDLDALVYVRGTLYSADGRKLTGSTGYRWIAIPTGVNAVRCSGLCVVALQGMPPQLPSNPAGGPVTAVPFRQLTTWLASATIPPGPARLLRYNVAYEDLWIARSDGVELAHVRVDGIVNGWILPALDHRQNVVIIEIGALATACAELFAVLGLIVIILVEVRSPSH